MKDPREYATGEAWWIACLDESMGTTDPNGGPPSQAEAARLFQHAGPVVAYRDLCARLNAADEQLRAANAINNLATALQPSTMLDEADAVIAAFKDALEELMTWQNGPPLETYREQWTKAMDNAQRLLYGPAPAGREG